MYFIHTKCMVKKFKHRFTDFTLNNCLFGSVNLTKNADLDGHGIGFSQLRHRILAQNFHLQGKAWEKISLFLELISADLCISIIKIKIS